MEVKKTIYVTQPALPPLDEFITYLKQIWGTRILTNNGPIHQHFEKELADYLGVKYISLFTNGTLALVTALQTLKITGEVSPLHSVLLPPPIHSGGIILSLSLLILSLVTSTLTRKGLKPQSHLSPLQ